MNASSWRFLLFPGEPLPRKIGWSFALLLASGSMISTAVAQISSVGIILTYLFFVARQGGGWTWSRSLVDLAIPLLVLARIVSIVFSVDPDASLLTVRTELPFYLLLFAFIWLFRHSTPDNMVLLVRLLVLGALVAAIIGIVVYLGGFHHRARSVTSGYYTLGMYLTAIFGLVLGIGKRREYFATDMLWYLILSVLFLGIVLTFNRIHWLIAGSLVVVVGISRDRRMLPALLVISAVMLVMSEPLRERIMSLMEPSGRMSDRDVLWREAGKLMWERPLTGFGTRSFGAIFPEVHEPIDPGVGSWHNDMLQIYMESGLLALVGYVVLLLTPIVTLFREIREKGREIDPLVAGFGIVTVSVFIGGFTGIFFTDPIIQPLTFLSIAVIVTRVQLHNS